MTITELRKSNGYQEAYHKILMYQEGFRFTVYYNQMTKAQANAMKILLEDCQRENLIQSVAIGLALSMEQTEETFIRL